MTLYSGTGDDGDSVNHFLFARYAPAHFELFFNHWAKPVFTFLSAPYAQFGFTGIKFFNLVTTVASSFLVFLTARFIGLKNPWMAMLIMFACPFGFVVALSGLTEPLFGLFTIIGIYLLAREGHTWSAIVISFLPFVRSEGLLIIGVFGLLFLIQKNWKAIASLSVGHLVLGMAGWYHHGTPFWVITKIPYATTESVYGSGDLFSMVDRLYFVIGIPVVILLILGALSTLPKTLVYLKGAKAAILVSLGCVLAMLAFHTVAWYAGMFNSMGLKRVFVAIIPFIGIIGLVGFNSLQSAARKVHEKTAPTILIITVIALIGFPFTSNNTALKVKDLQPSLGQTLAVRMMNELFPSNIPEGKTVFYSPVFYGESLNVDHFDPSRHRNLDLSTSLYIKTGDIILWDSDTPLHIDGLTLEQVQAQKQFRLLRSYSETAEGKTHELYVFEVM